MGEQLTLLLALVRSRLTDALDVDAIRSRFLAGQKPRKGAKADRKYVLIAPLSNSLLRDWPSSNYVDLGRAILDLTTADVLLVGSGGQGEEITEIANQIGDNGQRQRVKAMIGAPWSEVIPKIIGAESTIANNSGVGHIAALLGARCISVYSASHQSIEWGPVGENSVTVQAHVECGPCGFDTLRECTNGHRCMQELSSAAVLEALRKQCADLFVEAPRAETAVVDRSDAKPRSSRANGRSRSS